MKREIALRHKLNRVVNYLQLHCGSEIDLEHMANIACLSKYHFTRVFQDYVKETPYRYLYRTRLEYAARSLSFHPGKPITTIALESGFTDLQALSKAFRQRFRMSPSLFKSDDKSLADGYDSPGFLLNELEKKIVRIENRPAMRLAYARNFGPYLDTEIAIPRTSAKVIDWAKNKGLWTLNSACISLCPSNPALTPPHLCIFDAGVQVPEEIDEDETVSIQSVPAGRYAMLQIACSSNQLNQVWKWLAHKWLPQSGETYAMENCYQIFYPGHHGVIAPEQGVELCVRLLPLGAATVSIGD